MAPCHQSLQAALSRWSHTLAEHLLAADFRVTRTDPAGCIAERNGQQLGVTLAMDVQSSVQGPAQTQYRVEAFVMQLLPLGARRLHMRHADVLAELTRGARTQSQVFEALESAVAQACPAALTQRMREHCG